MVVPAILGFAAKGPRDEVREERVHRAGKGAAGNVRPAEVRAVQEFWPELLVTAPSAPNLTRQALVADDARLVALYCDVDVVVNQHVRAVAQKRGRLGEANVDDREVELGNFGP